ncbi:SusD family outer membrane lipoprotein NanU [Nibrella saemangeumensis]|uniref:SusD family outer membrane lipoprotein NanU n=1 Tax=Nibrella saemangeumensis TaxID=1084526 RepID=A0ABP8NEM6_9BACT
MKSAYKLLSITLVTVVLSTSSCTNPLDVEPTSIISNASFWKTEDDVTGALAGMYVKLRNEAQLNLFQLGEGRSEVMEWGKLVGTLDYDRLYLNTLDATFAGPSWIGFYSTINAANLVIKYAPNIPFRTEAAKNAALAQAYTMRAFVYFVLVRSWGDVPLRTEPTEGYSPETTNKERAPKAEVFRQIKEDIDKALQLYPSNAFSAGRNTWSKAATNALKADVYLWTAKQLNGGQADFTTALEACNEVQKADVELLPNYANVFAYTNKGNREILMAVRFQQLESNNNYFENMYIPTFVVPSNTDQATKDIIGIPGGNIVWTPSALVRSQFTTDDQRRNASFLEIYTTDASGKKNYYGSIVLKGRGMVEGGVRNFKDDVILYRYADVLLMKAEAKNALGQDPSDEINQVRKRAYGTAFDKYAFTKGTKEQNDEAILKERLLELAFEGKRWWDLIRFGKAFDIVPSLQNRKGQDHLLLFPISSYILSLEPKVQQNPGYN